MKRDKRTSISLSEDELGILDATANRLKLTRSQVVANLVLYQGMCGGDFPLTSKILNLPEVSMASIVKEIRTRAENDDPARPQSFRQWVKDVFGRADTDTLEGGTKLLLADLLNEYGKKDSRDAA
jgi:hypothetical protein